MNLKPEQWTSLGPLSISPVTARYCNMSLAELHPTKQAMSCGDLTLLPEETYFPVPWQEFHKFMTDPLKTTVEQVLHVLCDYGTFTFI